MPNVVKHVAQCPQLTIKTNYMATALGIAILLEFAVSASVGIDEFMAARWHGFLLCS